MGTIEISDWDGAEGLDTPEEMLAYLKASMEYGDPKTLSLTVNNIIRAIGMAEMAKELDLPKNELAAELSNPNAMTNVTQKIADTLSVKAATIATA